MHTLLIRPREFSIYTPKVQNFDIPIKLFCRNLFLLNVIFQLKQSFARQVVIIGDASVTIHFVLCIFPLFVVVTDNVKETQLFKE